MKHTDWKSTAELIGIAAIVASLIFVGLQMRLEADIAEVQAYTESAALTTAQTEILAEYRDLWIRGLNGEELDPVEQSIFASLAWAVYQRQVSVWQRRVRLDAGSPNTWVDRFAYQIYIYPGLREYWDQLLLDRSGMLDALGHNESTTSFTAGVQRALAILDERQPPIPKYKDYVIP
jgi:hypothetical protein